MTDDKRWAITVNLLSLIPALVKGVPEAIELFHRMTDTLKRGLTTDDLQLAADEFDAAATKLLATIAEAEAKAKSA